MHRSISTLPTRGRKSTTNKSGPTQIGRLPGTTFVLAVVAEFKRAAAATQRYEELKRMTSAGPCAARDVPRQIYREYYVNDEISPFRYVGGGRSERAICPTERAAHKVSKRSRPR